MAPTRNSRSGNKQYSSTNDVSLEKVSRKSDKGTRRIIVGMTDCKCLYERIGHRGGPDMERIFSKFWTDRRISEEDTMEEKPNKKYSDKLGTQWSEEELERFYEAYRKYGKDWKKVAAVVHNRSIEMVEALYTTNRAYLSLPEGTASVVGLIAMMIDYYNMLEESDSEGESIGPSASQKPLKRKRGKLQLSDSKDPSQSRSIALSDGYLSLLKRRNFEGSQPRAVRKRTPRFPISYSRKTDHTETYASPNKRGPKSEVDANEDEVAHVAALTLTEASQRGGSSQISQTLDIKSSPSRSWERMNAQSDTARAKFCDAAMDESCLVGTIRSRGTENGCCARDTTLMDMEGVGAVEVCRKGKKFYRKKEKREDIVNDQYDDGGEACSGTEEGLNFGGGLKGKVGIMVSNAKFEHSSPQGQRKRSKKLFFGDEICGFDALQTLADLSLSTIESESSAQLKEERTIFDIDDKPSALEAPSTGHYDGIKLPATKQKVLNAISGAEGTIPKTSKLGRDSSIHVNVASEVKEQLQPPHKTWKRKRKSLLSKISNDKPHIDSLAEPLTTEVLAEEENKSGVKTKHSCQSLTFSNPWKSARLSDNSLDSGHIRVDTDLAVSTAQAPAASQASFSLQRRNRRKKNLPRSSTSKELESYQNIVPNRLKYSTSLQDSAKEKLSCCLSSFLVRRWCTFEWFYSAIDYPWFAKRVFVEYLNHVGLGHIPRLTHVEWSVIRSSLGKPRRFCEHFLHEEREKLKQYREAVRKHYSALRAGITEGLPTDLARPLSVGQRVIALHPKTRELYDGNVLTVDHDKCRVQFDRPEIGVEFVTDIDCMPLNPLDNMPEALRRQNVTMDQFSVISMEPQINGHCNFGGSMMLASTANIENVSTPMNTLTKHGKVDANRAVSQAKAAAIDIVQGAYSHPTMLAQNQAREADIKAVSEVKRALDKKEALLMELSRNHDVVETQNNEDCCVKNCEPFKKHYATVLVQLKEVGDQGSYALHHLRQHNPYTGNTMPSWLKPPANSSVHGGLSSCDDSSISQESGPSVVVIVKSSRLKAHKMVDAAVQAFTSRKEGEDAFVSIGQALDSIDNQQLTYDSRAPVIRCQQLVNGSLGYHNRLTSCTSEPLLASDASGTRLCDDSDESEPQIPSELITSCVAALLTIQTCTERQYPPGDVAQILDSALTSLHPCCPQNLPIYREIQMCVGRIKTQILALVPA